MEERAQAAATSRWNFTEFLDSTLRICLIPESRLEPCTQNERPITKEVYIAHHFPDINLRCKKKRPTELQQL
ncbi:Hypothetical protein SMAX5B_020304 [Scophthalmus maximus]|uniref:Uncharacterized protein n=1 Tax=Scophthalmus maximus TaxID=52904 RepID=A0A2U9CLC0_SCOMX|nr:Hypothetical protein SMAX5B_020304 [Scophthalmus maximus]